MKHKTIKAMTGLMLVGGSLIAPLLTSCKKPTQQKEYHIMSMSDIRGEIPGYGDIDFKDTKEEHPGAIRTVDAMQQIAKKASDYVILSGGDQISSGKFSACTQGETMYPVLKAMGVRYSAVGNHEWDWGKERLENPDYEKSYDKLGRTDKTEGNYFLASNILLDNTKQDYKWELDQTKPKFLTDFEIWNSTRVKWADPYKVVDLGGHKICLMGLTTRDTIHDGNQQYLENRFSFMDYNAAINYSKYYFKQQDAKTFNQIESFILLTHCGATEEDSWISGEASDLANNIDTPIDAILAGHTQKPVCGFVWNNKFDRRVAIAEVKEKMRGFIDLKITFDDSKPVGKRFKKIEPSIITPDIAGKSFDAATQQLENIISHPRNDIVKNVCEVYEEQKLIALEKLEKPIGTTTDGLSYLQTDHLKDYLYPEDVSPTFKKDILVEQAGAFTAKSMIGGFNKYFDDQSLSPTVYKKANIAFISNDSINRGIDPQFLIGKNVTLNELYNLFPYDEYAVTASLTYYQLEQIIKYMFTGKKQHSISDRCTDEFLVAEGQLPIVYPDLAFPYGPAQFYGFAFDVEDADKSDKQFRKYNYVDGTLKIYDPDETSGCKLDDPTTWKGKDYWKDSKKYITIVLNSFNYNYGNNQSKMIKDFALINGAEEPEPIKVKELHSVDVRDLSEIYIKSLTSDIAMSDEICKLLARKV